MTSDGMVFREGKYSLCHDAIVLIRIALLHYHTAFRWMQSSAEHEIVVKRV